MIFSMTWETLEELHAVSLSYGYTQEQFQEAVDVVGYDPHRVAVYLQRFPIDEGHRAYDAGTR